VQANPDNRVDFHNPEAAGPVLSRFDRFLLIAPRAEGDPAPRQLTNTNLNFVSKLIVNISIKIHENLALQSSRIQIKQLQSLKMSLQAAKSNL